MANGQTHTKHRGDLEMKSETLQGEMNKVHPTTPGTTEDDYGNSSLLTHVADSVNRKKRILPNHKKSIIRAFAKVNEVLVRSGIKSFDDANGVILVLSLAISL